MSNVASWKHTTVTWINLNKYNFIGTGIDGFHYNFHKTKFNIKGGTYMHSHNTTIFELVNLMKNNVQLD